MEIKKNSSYNSKNKNSSLKAAFFNFMWSNISQIKSLAFLLWSNIQNILFIIYALYTYVTTKHKKKLIFLTIIFFVSYIILCSLVIVFSVVDIIHIVKNCHFFEKIKELFYNYNKLGMGCDNNYTNTTSPNSFPTDNYKTGSDISGNKVTNPGQSSSSSTTANKIKPDFNIKDRIVKRTPEELYESCVKGSLENWYFYKIQQYGFAEIVDNITINKEKFYDNKAIHLFDGDYRVLLPKLINNNEENLRNLSNHSPHEFNELVRKLHEAPQPGCKPSEVYLAQKELAIIKAKAAKGEIPIIPGDDLNITKYRSR